MLTLGGSKWKSDKAGALVYFTYSVPLFHILLRTTGLFSSRVQEGTLFHFFRKLFRRISIFWLPDMTKHNIKNTYVSYLPFFLGINKRSV